ELRGVFLPVLIAEGFGHVSQQGVGARGGVAEYGDADAVLELVEALRGLATACGFMTKYEASRA
nr:hypothetical protein [Duncaniella sp.]